MKALRFEKGKLRLDRKVPAPRVPGEALVRVKKAGICNTDLEIVRGYAAFSGVLGHEFVGVVEESPDPTLTGCRVVGEINAGCGSCGLCRAGDPRHCPSRTVLGIVGRDGAFAEYLTLPTRNLLSVPDSVEDRAAVFTEPLAAACSILEQLQPAPGGCVVVVGDGKLGQLIARVLAAGGCDLTLAGKHESKLRLARAAGIRSLPADEIAGDFARSCDVVVEASGSPAGLSFALGLVRPRGTLVLKSTFHGAVEVDTSRIVVDEIRIAGSRCGRFAPALRLLEERRIDVEPLITAELPLDEGVSAMELAAAPGTMKVLLSPPVS
jgi:threonine dehydrogenase-like Zn-dependent dehydrogenase